MTVEPASPTTLAAVRDACDQAFDRAGGDAAGSRFALADHIVQVDVAGRELFDRLRPALAHAETTATGRADLSIRLWDARATGVALPVPVPEDDPKLNGVLDVSDDRQIMAHRPRTSTTWIDRSASTVVGCFPSAEGLALFDRGKPMQLPLAIWHLDCGIPMAHAGVVARNGRGVLFPGKGGSGHEPGSGSPGAVPGPGIVPVFNGERFLTEALESVASLLDERRLQAGRAGAHGPVRVVRVPEGLVEQADAVEHFSAGNTGSTGRK